MTINSRATRMLKLPEDHPAMSESDEQIIAEILSGETERFRDLVVRYQEQILRMFLRQTGSSPIARDLTQETFVAAYRGLERFRGDSQFSTWLTRIALNTCKNFFRSKQYREMISTTSLREEIPDSQSDELEYQLTLLRRFIPALPFKLRDVLVLVSLEHRSYEEAAAILDIPVGTVRSRMSAARVKLRQMFQSEGL